jgi:hypothetical protein
MLTALISTVLGLISGALPKVLDEVKDSRAHQREIEFLKLQNQLQIEREKADAGAKMHEAEQAAIAEEIRATREQLSAIIETQGRPTGNSLIDGFNAVLRPTVASGIMALFFWVAVVYIHGVMAQYGAGKIDVQTLATAVWGSLVGEGILATLGFVFGYRSTLKRG